MRLARKISITFMILGLISLGAASLTILAIIVSGAGIVSLVPEVIHSAPFGEFTHIVLTPQLIWWIVSLIIMVIAGVSNFIFDVALEIREGRRSPA